jgi:hypothetical protein
VVLHNAPMRVESQVRLLQTRLLPEELLQAAAAIVGFSTSPALPDLPVLLSARCDDAREADPAAPSPDHCRPGCNRRSHDGMRRAGRFKADPIAVSRAAANARSPMRLAVLIRTPLFL